MASTPKKTPFEFFSVSFSNADDVPLTGRLPLVQANEKLDLLFRNKKLPFKLNDVKPELPNHVYDVEDKVYLIRLHNQQIISYIKEESGAEGEKTYSADQVKSYPYLYLIVDNRNGITQIAIMKSPVFGSNLDKVCRLLTKIMCKWMVPYGIEAEISPCRIPMKFWTYVRKCEAEGHRLMNMNISFYNDNFRTINAPTRLRKNVNSMLDIARLTNALRGELKLIAHPASSRESMLLNEKVKDIAQIVGLCSTNNFYLQVKFKGMPVYKYNGDDNVRAIFDMPPSAITEMIESEEKTDAFIEWAEGTKRGLIIWLDKVYKQIHDYKVEAQKHASK